MMKLYAVEKRKIGNMKLLISRPLALVKNAIEKFEKMYLYAAENYSAAQIKENEQC